MSYRIRLTDPEGVTRVKEFEGEYHAYMWEEGNYSCDCNRQIFLYDRDLDEATCDDGTPRIEAALVIEIP